MLKRNPRREATLLAKWKDGKAARDAARETGIPEGSTYHYYRKFNKDPENYNRLAKSLKPSEALRPQEIVMQWGLAMAAEDVSEKYNALMKEGKYVEAKDYIEAKKAYDRYINSQFGNITSAIARYSSAPKKYQLLIPKYVEESIKMQLDAGVELPAAVEQFQMTVAAMFDKLPPNHASQMFVESEGMKQRYLAAHKPATQGA